jgi:hypothetical protein
MLRIVGLLCSRALVLRISVASLRRAAIAFVLALKPAIFPPPFPPPIPPEAQLASASERGRAFTARYLRAL